MQPDTAARIARRFIACSTAACLLAVGLAPAVAEKSERIFNGRDLAGWEGNPAYWSVQEGAVVGKLDGAKVLMRICDDEPDSLHTMMASAAAINETNALHIPMFLEPLPVVLLAALVSAGVLSRRRGAAVSSLGTAVS